MFKKTLHKRTLRALGVAALCGGALIVAPGDASAQVGRAQLEFEASASARAGGRDSVERGASASRRASVSREAGVSRRADASVGHGAATSAAHRSEVGTRHGRRRGHAQRSPRNQATTTMVATVTPRADVHVERSRSVSRSAHVGVGTRPATPPPRVASVSRPASTPRPAVVRVQHVTPPPAPRVVHVVRRAAPTPPSVVRVETTRSVVTPAVVVTTPATEVRARAHAAARVERNIDRRVLRLDVKYDLSARQERRVRKILDQEYARIARLEVHYANLPNGQVRARREARTISRNRIRALLSAEQRATQAARLQVAAQVSVSGPSC